MNPVICEIIRRSAIRLEPQPTGQSHVLKPLHDIQAVLFDVYGTLFISACGEIGTTESPVQESALSAALAAAGIGHRLVDSSGIERFLQTVRDSHAESRKQGVDYPEIDVLDVWSRTLDALAAEDLVKQANLTPWRIQLLAIEYEMRTNPVWPMPGSEACLRTLGRTGLTLGIVSNAQIYTPELFPALLNHTCDELGLHTELSFFSYRYKQAKPGTFLYEQAAGQLERLGISASQTLYVGNDMLNDVAAAHRVGFRTALFAGDRRSLRLRTDDSRVAGVTPDLVLTHLDQLPPCLPPA